MTMGAGGSGTLFDFNAGLGRVNVDAIADIVFARISDDGYAGRAGIDSNSGTGRLGLEMSARSSGGVGASLALAYRGDFGDAASGSGLELGGGLEFAARSVGLSVDLDGRVLVLQSDDLKEYGFSGDISWSPRGKEKGPYVSFRPYLGATGDKRDTLWDRRIEDMSIDSSAQRKYELEFGYGMPLMRDSGTVKVFARGDIEDGETTTKSGGVDIETVGGVTAGYETVDRIGGAPVEHRGYIEFTKQF